MNIKKFAILFAHGFAGWGICGAIIGIGRSTTSVENTLIIHAILVPIVFGLLSLLYFSRFNYTTPLRTAVFFFAEAILLDFFVVAPFFEKSYVMFTSLLGTWIPFASIFLASYGVGVYISQQKRQIVKI